MSDPFLDANRFAFRLELLPHYADDSSGRSDELEFFLKTGSVPSGHNDSWVDLIKMTRARGVRVMRLRAVSEPLSAYEEFELKKGYLAGMEAGEEIRIIGKSDLNEDFDCFDYWCFDAEIIEVIQYGAHGEHLGADIREMTPEEQEMLQYHLGLFNGAKSPADYLSEIIVRRK